MIYLILGLFLGIGRSIPVRPQFFHPAVTTLSADTLQEGTYKLIHKTNCCDTFRLMLRIKRYSPNRYYITMDCFDTIGALHRVAGRCIGNFTIERLAGKTVLLQKGGGLETVDSLQLHLVGDLLLFRQFSQKDALLDRNFEFKYYSKEIYSLFDFDLFNNRYYVPKFSRTVQINCYLYPDEILLPQSITFTKSTILHKATMSNRNTQKDTERFYFIYFEPKEKMEWNYYNDFKYHMWIKEKDFLKAFLKAPRL